MKLLLTTLHSRYSHASLALPALAASLAGVAGVATVIREYTVNERPEPLLERLVAADADVLAFSCHIWNIELTLRLAAELKLLRSSLFIILGGPEVSFGCHALLTANPHIDLVVRGEGEITMAELLRALVASEHGALADDRLMAIDGITFRSGDEIISTPERAPARLAELPSPFTAGLVDCSKPLVYLETSRGCPFACAFCLSSTENSVRTFLEARVENDLLQLMQQGVATIKLVDRTFNFDAERANRIWRFIFAHNRTSHFHFEIAADLLTDANIELLAQAPPDTFRFEIGVQSTAVDTLAAVGRSSDLERLFANVRRLKEETAVTLHLDLVAGLPGEDFAGFTASLAGLLAAEPHHIQVEPLKMLKGTELRRKAAELGYCYSPFPPYRILQSRWLSFEEIGRIERCSQALDEIYNSGRFGTTLALLSTAGVGADLFTRLQQPLRSGGGRLAALFEQLAGALTGLFPELATELLDALRFDYCLAGYPGSSLPSFMDNDRAASASPATLQDIGARLGLPRGERVRVFAARFMRDFTQKGFPPAATAITFVYRRDGQGEKVLCLAVPEA
ncbi:MAG: DUF4080 domain-containing protein [Geobacter sp.]|nr:DUF4080 domain-containing protein [Geobacter sp.]